MIDLNSIVSFDVQFHKPNKIIKITANNSHHVIILTEQKHLRSDSRHHFSAMLVYDTCAYSGKLYASFFSKITLYSMELVSDYGGVIITKSTNPVIYDSIISAMKHGSANTINFRNIHKPNQDC